MALRTYLNAQLCLCTASSQGGVCVQRQTFYVMNPDTPWISICLWRLRFAACVHVTRHCVGHSCDRSGNAKTLAASRKNDHGRVKKDNLLHQTFSVREMTRKSSFSFKKHKDSSNNYFFVIANRYQPTLHTFASNTNDPYCVITILLCNHKWVFCE